jgi:hypothetical protein
VLLVGSEVDWLELISFILWLILFFFVKNPVSERVI